MTQSPDFPSPRMRIFLALYAVAWAAMLPALMMYLAWRGRRDPLYRHHMAERFGGGDPAKAQVQHVWVHAVSLGEMRSAVPLVRALLQQGEHVVITNFTPTGRREAQSVFATEVTAGQLCVRYVPFEFHWCFARFFQTFRPKYGLVMEVEFWPRMMASARRCGVALFLCNGQYPEKSLERDIRKAPLRAELARGFAGVMVKSSLQQDRFRALGQGNSAVTGEMRFEQPIPQHLIAAAHSVRPWIAGKRPVIALASVVAGEDDIYLPALVRIRDAYVSRGEEAPLFVYVPRAPERFVETGQKIRAAGLTMISRSDAFDAALSPVGTPPEVDVLLGDSMGEMYFYLGLADRVLVGGGFTPKGAHNIIEPLALGKPVLVGPEIWTIEYPAREAIAGGVLCHLSTGDELVAALAPENLSTPDPAGIAAFLAEHGGAVARSLDAIPILLANADRITSR